MLRDAHVTQTVPSILRLDNYQEFMRRSSVLKRLFAEQLLPYSRAKVQHSIDFSFQGLREVLIYAEIMSSA